MQVTAKQLAAKLSLDYVAAASLLKLSVATGQGREHSKIKTSLSGKGKPSTVYEVNEILTFSLTQPTQPAQPAVDEPIGSRFPPEAA